MKVVVLRPGALGDAVVSVPVLESLTAAGARVVAIGSPAFRLAVECGAAAEHVSFDDARLLGLFAPAGSCELVSGCALCITYGRRPDPLLAGNLARSGVGSIVAWPSEPGPGLHIVDHLLEAVVGAGFAVVSREPTLPAGAAWRDAARAWLAERGMGEGAVVIHPGSGGRAKQWPAERFAELAARLAEAVVWLLGPAEMEDADLRAIGERVGIVAEGLPLPTLAGLLASCRAYVGNDSGVSHLAAAVGTPTVAIFGPTDPAVWAPRGAHVVVLGGPQAGGFEGISVDEVADAVERARPLTRPW